jgi:hypothetical protein
VTLIGIRQVIEDFRPFFRQAGEALFERLKLAFGLVPVIEGETQSFDVSLKVGDRVLQARIIHKNRAGSRPDRQF